MLSDVARSDAERSKSEAGSNYSIDYNLCSRLLHLVVGHLCSIRFDLQAVYIVDMIDQIEPGIMRDF